ncbi:MAG: nucleotide-binding protein [Oscillospiraceae bacterium]|nr:nucleotide-binding protein [Oscillospiraceae bacterium]
MKIFIAGSKESIELMREIECWLQENDHEPMPWDGIGRFPPGEQTFLTLIDISKKVDGAICIFGADDELWYRADAARQPRDNVLIEYGLFAGALGPRKALICRHDSPKQATDLLGIVSVDLSLKRRARGKLELLQWAKNLHAAPIDPVTLKLHGYIHQLETEKEKLEKRVTFEKEKSSDLKELLRKENIIDFSVLDLEKDGYWKLLFEYHYIEGATTILSQTGRIPSDIRNLLNDCGAEEIANHIAWNTTATDPTSTVRMTKKALRVFRQMYKSDTFSQFIKKLPNAIRIELTILAHTTMAQIKVE